jgi:signal peptide peptidase SppA
MTGMRFPFLNRTPRVIVLRLSGVIAQGARGRLSDEALAPLIERAFRRRPVAVALVVNSPGGSPVQSSLIAARIRRLADERAIPVHAFVEDVAASGGYWLACAADSIWLDPASIVGSIGVISSSFGLHDFITRHGLERRVHTSGTSKSMLDPFRPEKPEDVERLRGWQDHIHGTFIEHVKSRRGTRLADDPQLFTGDIWIGSEAVKRGLADGIGHLVPKMQSIFGPRVAFQTYSQRRGLLQRFGMGAASGVLDGLDERWAYARFGL